MTKFRSERFDVIIVDTSGRHRQESELFEEMVQIGQAVEPDMSVLVLDGAIGESAVESRKGKDRAEPLHRRQVKRRKLNRARSRRRPTLVPSS